MSKIINIPKSSEGDFSEKILDSLLQVIIETLNSEEPVVWNLNHLSFVHPFLIAPMSIFKNWSPIPIEINIPQDDKLNKYLNQISFAEPIDVHSGSSDEQKLATFKEKTYIPICRYNIFSGTDPTQPLFKDLIFTQKGFNKDLITPVAYILGELLDNMTEHSMAKSGYIFSQYSKTANVLNICIADDGISILGSFKRRKKQFVLDLNSDEAEILKFATEGKSTKNLPNGQNRGFGLSTSKKMLVEGLKGEFFIISGNAVFGYNFNYEWFLNLPSNLTWPGTLILLSFPMDKPLSFNYINYLE